MPRPWVNDEAGAACHRLPVRSLRSRLFLLWILSIVAALAVGVLLVGLYRQSSTAQLDRAEDAVGQACTRIADRYNYYATGWAGPAAASDDPALRSDLAAVVEVALEGRPGLAGGIWRQPDGVLAATATLGTELRDSVAALTTSIANDDRPGVIRITQGAATTLLDACALRGPIPGLYGFAFARVEAAPGQYQLRLGLGVLLALVLAMSGWLTVAGAGLDAPCRPHRGSAGGTGRRRRCRISPPPASANWTASSPR